MNPLDIFTKEISFSGWVVLFAAGLFLIAIVILVSSVFSLRRKLKLATTPKFGFAGKPIYPLLATLMISISIPLLIYSFTQDTSFVQEAEENIEIDYIYELVSEGEESSTLRFNLLPTVDGEEYGKKSFDIFWLFEGQEVEDLYEFNRTKDDPSNILVSLKPGRYRLKILVTYENKTETIEDFVTVE